MPKELSVQVGSVSIIRSFSAAGFQVSAGNGQYLQVGSADSEDFKNALIAFTSLLIENEE